MAKKPGKDKGKPRLERPVEDRAPNSPLFGRNKPMNIGERQSGTHPARKTGEQQIGGLRSRFALTPPSDPKEKSPPKPQ